MNFNTIYVSKPKNTTLAAAALVGWSTVLSGCAGPTTPLGAVWSWQAPQRSHAPVLKPEKASTEKELNIRFSPSRQIMHRPTPLIVTLESSHEIAPDQLTILYNGLDVTPTFLRQARIHRTMDPDTGIRSLTLHLPKIRLYAVADHRIEVLYKDTRGDGAYARYGPPRCYAYDQRRIASTEGFDPPPELLLMIERLSREGGFNPAFTAALIARESSFNPRAISWAKAIGLTQVTPIAEMDMVRFLPSWPRYPGINSMPVPLLKGMVMTGRINDTNEWRLDPRRSIRGGLFFMRTLDARWSSTENQARIEALSQQPPYEDPRILRTRLMLASYNAGYSRVQIALNRSGAQWLDNDELKGIRKYVNLITSYCDHFSTQTEPEVTHESKT